MPKYSRLSPPNKDLAERIRIARLKSRMSQAELSKKIGFGSPSAVFYIENGKRFVKVEDVYKIANVLKISIGELLGIEVGTTKSNGLETSWT